MGDGNDLVISALLGSLLLLLSSGPDESATKSRSLGVVNDDRQPPKDVAVCLSTQLLLLFDFSVVVEALPDLSVASVIHMSPKLKFLLQAQYNSAIANRNSRCSSRWHGAAKFAGVS